MVKNLDSRLKSQNVFKTSNLGVKCCFELKIVHQGPGAPEWSGVTEGVKNLDSTSKS